MLRFPTIRFLFVLVSFASVFYILGFSYQFVDSRFPHPLNATLGFGAAILISLPERTDRRDAISLITSLSNITITHTVEAVRGENVALKARPIGKAIGELKLSNAHWGSWRSHLDALRYVVDNRIETALILEDDVDWEPSIKTQMLALANGLQTSAGKIPGVRRAGGDRPYGMNWDILHLGVSRVSLPPKTFGSNSYHDPSLSIDSFQDTECHGNWFCYAKYLRALETPKQSRSIAQSYEPIGLVAFAVTFHGAQKLLYLLSWRGLDAGLDESIRDAVRAGDLTGWTVVPPLFGSWTTKTSADSDIRPDSRNKAPDNMNSKPRGIKNSIRQNLKNMLGKDGLDKLM